MFYFVRNNKKTYECSLCPSLLTFSQLLLHKLLRTPTKPFVQMSSAKNGYSVLFLSFLFILHLAALLALSYQPDSHIHTVSIKQIGWQVSSGSVLLYVFICRSTNIYVN